ncbi:hypothetical protein SAMN04488550_0104 [Gordonia malaquae]|nr:hypothetical protein SAMN04488550_0005 [Gordonia malaquae]SEB47676.1 hypothetical protein SAMN04488550_0104 [Gordonia malaquae]
MTTTHTRNRERRDWGTLLAGLVALTAIAAAIVLAISLAPASAETPAERCKRETTAYNNAWKNSWAASHPGKKPSDAPKPPVPYKCGGNNDGPPPTVQPTTTAPEAPSETVEPTPDTPRDGAGPNLNAPTERRDDEVGVGPGQRAIGADSRTPRPGRTASAQPAETRGRSGASPSPSSTKVAAQGQEDRPETLAWFFHR